MEQKRLLVTIMGLSLLLVVAISAIGYVAFNQEEKVFYVGVTYCGSSVQEAKELVDTVRDCTNLFVLQSGVLQYDFVAMEEIGEYVVASNLSYAVYGGTRNEAGLNRWLNEAKERWGKQFIGVYYNDEVGGYMLDKTVFLETAYQIEGLPVPMPRVTKTKEGTIMIYNYENSQNTKPPLLSTVTYWPDGKVVVENVKESVTISYYSNGTITILESKKNQFYTAENITKYTNTIPLYEQILEENPIQNYDDAAMAYVNMNRNLLEDIDKAQLKKEQVLVFTADYGLYWWNYKSGYDLVLAELAWNNTVAQEIGLVRGAANLQNKQWGTCITWKYTHPPYLTDGEEMFEQMKASYEAGAEYILIFNYSEDPTNPNTLQKEHFQALERFWNEIVQNPDVTHGNIKAEAVLVLPQNYGWGIRYPADIIWGIWYANEDNQEIWNQLQNKLDQHGLKLDIIFEDPNHPIKGKYNNIYYWNQK